MQFIIVNNRHGRSAVLRFNALVGVLIGALLVGLGGALFVGGVYVAQVKNEASLMRQYGATGHAFKHEVRAQPAIIDDVPGDAKGQLDVLAARLSKLQGHVLRLDALGERLARMVGLEDFQFGAEHPPGMGGPVPTEYQEVQRADFEAALDKLSSELNERADKLQAMEHLLMNQDLREAMMPAGMPVDNGFISSGFGLRTDPISGHRAMHEGIDFAGRSGSPIHAVGAGIVTWSGRRSGYGNIVEISHGDGYTTVYAHNKKNLVKVGQRVGKGETIALLGSTGRSTGAHVHFEVLHNGKVVNPKKFLSVN